LQSKREYLCNMKNKNNRLEAIRLIISEQDIKNQDQLLKVLNERGYSVTQATLSRDLKKMKISKVANTYGDYIYVLPNHALLQKKQSASSDDLTSNQPRYGFVSLNFSGNMAVIKTRPGYASSLAYDVDNHTLPGVLGTIAGDDTLLIVLAEGANRQEIKRLLEPIIISL